MGIHLQHIIRDVVHRQCFHREYDAVCAILVCQADGQPLTGPEHDFPDLTGDGIGTMDPHAAAYANHGFRAEGGAGNDGGVSPDGFAGDISGNRSDLRILTCERHAIIYFFGAAGPDNQRGGIHPQDAGHLHNIGEVSRDVLTGAVENGVIIDDVGGLASIGPGARGGHLDAAVRREAVDQHIRGTAQGIAVIELAGGLRHQFDFHGPGPIPSRRMEIAHFAAFFIHARKQVFAFRAAVDDAPGQVFVAVDEFAHEIVQVGGRQVRHDGGGLPVRGFSQGNFLTGGHVEHAVCAGIIREINPTGTFQDTDGGRGGAGISCTHRRSFLLHIDECASDTHSHGSGLDIERFVLIQFFRHVDEDSAFREVQPDMTVLLDELHTGVRIQGDDFCIVQAHRRGTGLAGAHGFTAVEADVFHDETRDALRIPNFHIAIIAKQAHSGGAVAFCRSAGRQGGQDCDEKDAQEENGKCSAVHRQYSFDIDGQRPSGKVQDELYSFFLLLGMWNADGSEKAWR